MKSFFAAAMLLVATGTAQAALINAQYNGVLNSNVTVSFNISGTPGNGPAGLLSFTNTALNQIFLAYCLEPNISVGAIGQQITYNQDPTLTLTDAKQAAIRLLLGQVAAPFSNSLSQVDQAALQIGIWEIARETTAGPYSISGGAAVFTFSNTATVLDRATTFLTAVNNNSGTAFTGVIALTNNSLQDLVVIGDPGTNIPEPATLSLVGGALLALGLVSRRK